ncbi:hypothetical protein [Piscinibacter terrae]|uniref:hypothetical protein n=1 Tax=Piscinibacter terrae TaxID=2496871 RepID=UPI000F5A2464|nr:hypothetical protein [Albitalea terrae]
MNDLKDLLGKECVLVESGRGMVVRCLRFYDDDALLWAEFEVAHPTVFVMNRVRLNGEPAIKSWDDNPKRIGDAVKIGQPRNQIFRSPKPYLHFSSPYGGTRLFFLNEYVDKVRRKDADGWDWEDLMKVASR